MKPLSNHLNFNTLLLMVLGALVTAGVTRADHILSSVTAMEVQTSEMLHRLEKLEDRLTKDEASFYRHNP